MLLQFIITGKHFGGNVNVLYDTAPSSIDEYILI
jgi:hypothetical protein